MTVATLVEQLQKLPPDMIAVWYDSESSQYQEVIKLQTVEVGIRYAGDGETWPVWENYYPDDNRQKTPFTAIEINAFSNEY